MLIKGVTPDAFRVSVSSAPSTSSHGSAQDDCDALGDVYIWGESRGTICENPAAVAGAAKNISSAASKRADVLLPRILESNLVLDVHHIACGVHHSALVTRQGEVFTWGEESGGRLGHGVGLDVIQPQLVESLALHNASFVACGEFHTCAITLAGELYTWGDGTHNAGLLGHGSDISHWIPKRVLGPLDGLQVAYVTCGPWHTALITTSGQLFTFGDGAFGVLGHGNRESVAYPREVESLMGLKTITVACGVWHTAAVVEVIVANSNASASSGKLFTWGDGDKNRLGHGDKEPRLKPTCVSSLIEYNFHKLACGHRLTVALTTSGNVFTMGSTIYGQLGNPFSDGNLPCLVEDKLATESVEDVACGSYHVAVLTSKNEVFTWGKGANGRLGHGDTGDRKAPSLVEALKDRHVKYIACGSTFTAAVCVHRWVSGAEQSQCSACRQSFGFTRKKHNCYNCGLIHCHSCSSRKTIRAALAPNPGKFYRVCDSCYMKLNNFLDAGEPNNKRNVMHRLSGENTKDQLDKVETKLSKGSFPTNLDLIKNLDTKAAKQGKKVDSFSFVRTSQISSFFQLKDIPFAGGVDMRRSVPRPVNTSVGQSGINSRVVSPSSRRPRPPRSATPIPTTSGLSFSKSIADSLKKTNELLHREVQKLRSQVDSLSQRCENHELELQRASRKTHEAVILAAEEAAKCKAAKEVIKSLTIQLKDMAEMLPAGVYDSGDIRRFEVLYGMDINSVQHSDAKGDQLRIDARNGTSHSPSPAAIDSYTNRICMHRDSGGAAETNTVHSQKLQNSDRRDVHTNVGLQYGTNGSVPLKSRLEDTDGKESGNHQSGENGSKVRSPTNTGNLQVEAEWIEQYEPGVYITLIALHDGTRDLKRVRFSRRRFGEHQAEIWWSDNREKVYEKYKVRFSGKVSSGASVHSSHTSEGISPSSQA